KAEVSGGETGPSSSSRAFFLYGTTRNRMQQTVSAAGPRRVLGTPLEDVPALRWLKCATMQSDMSRFFTARQHLLLCCEEAALHGTSKARTRILFPTLSIQSFPLNLCAGPVSPERNM
ncbi:MAG: uncharacterized protein A8A55_2582, partial [Amphiamblys sp. WSBS2006]